MVGSDIEVDYLMGADEVIVIGEGVVDEVRWMRIW